MKGIREKHVFITSDGTEFTERNAAELHEIKLNGEKLDRIEKYLRNRHKSDIYPLNEEGIWEVRGEDPNCDLGGHHHEPLIGHFKGKFKNVLEYAVSHKDWFVWGIGGSIKKINVIPIME
jgi:hypothetical protein